VKDDKPATLRMYEYILKAGAKGVTKQQIMDALDLDFAKVSNAIMHMRQLGLLDAVPVRRAGVPRGKVPNRFCPSDKRIV
jgi:hypothetical protein